MARAQAVWPHLMQGFSIILMAVHAVAQLGGARCQLGGRACSPRKSPTCAMPNTHLSSLANTCLSVSSYAAGARAGQQGHGTLCSTWWTVQQVRLQCDRAVQADVLSPGTGSLAEGPSPWPALLALLARDRAMRLDREPWCARLRRMDLGRDVCWEEAASSSSPLLPYSASLKLQTWEGVAILHCIRCGPATSVLPKRGCTSSWPWQTTGKVNRQLSQVSDTCSDQRCTAWFQRG